MSSMKESNSMDLNELRDFVADTGEHIEVKVLLINGKKKVYLKDLVSDKSHVIDKNFKLAIEVVFQKGDCYIENQKKINEFVFSKEDTCQISTKTFDHDENTFTKLFVFDKELVVNDVLGYKEVEIASSENEDEEVSKVYYDFSTYSPNKDENPVGQEKAFFSQKEEKEGKVAYIADYEDKVDQAYLKNVNEKAGDYSSDASSKLSEGALEEISYYSSDASSKLSEGALEEISYYSSDASSKLSEGALEEISNCFSEVSSELPESDLEERTKTSEGYSDKTQYKNDIKEGRVFRGENSNFQPGVLNKKYNINYLTGDMPISDRLSKVNEIEKTIVSVISKNYNINIVDKLKGLLAGVLNKDVLQEDVLQEDVLQEDVLQEDVLQEDVVQDYVITFEDEDNIENVKKSTTGRSEVSDEMQKFFGIGNKKINFNSALVPTKGTLTEAVAEQLNNKGPKNLPTPEGQNKILSSQSGKGHRGRVASFNSGLLLI